VKAKNTERRSYDSQVTSGGFSRTVRLDSLTGLRFFAALAVFMHHAAAYQRSPEWFGFLANAGDAGVSFFFMLSGFVLSWSAKNDDTVGRFYQRRAARILPMYWIAWIPGAIYAVTFEDSKLSSLIPSLLLMQSWFPQKDVHFAGNSVGWSLSTEVFFYLLFPLFFVAVRNLSTRWITFALVGSLVFVITIPLALRPTAPVGDGYWLIYLFPITRFFEFAAGVTLAILMRHGLRVRLPFALAGAIALAVCVGANWLPLYLLLVVATAVPFLLLIGSAANADLAGRRTLMSWRPLVKLGEWSFAFYLVHLIVLRVVIAMNERTFMLPWWATSLIALLLGLILAAGLFEFLEKPLERRFRPTPMKVSPEANLPTGSSVIR